MIKNTLINTGVYEDVVEILESIAGIKESTLPVDLYMDGVKPSYRIDVDNLQHEAEIFLFGLEKDILVKGTNQYETLWRYINNKMDTMLHNYAVSLSHNHKPSIKMSVIRKYMIIENLLINISFPGTDDDDEEWYIPENWLNDNEPMFGGIEE